MTLLKFSKLRKTIGTFTKSGWE